MKKQLLLLLTLLISGLCQSQTTDTLILNHNNVSALISDGGYMFMDEFTGTAAYEVPAGSGTNSIFAMSGWFGALDVNNQLHMAYNKYGNGTISPGPIADSIFYDSSVYLNQYGKSIWSVTEVEIQNHIANYNQPGYVTPQSILDWPGNGDLSLGVAQKLAPFVDVNNDWQYNPADGDYPEIRGDQAVYVIMNDHYADTSLMNSSMGIEIHLMVYQHLDGTYLDNTTFLHYRVFNRSTMDYADYRQSLYADMDIGYYADDYVGCDTVNHVAYTYNGDNFDEDASGNQGYGANPPCQGMVCLSHEMKGLTHFTSASAYPYSDPNSPIEYWNFMNGLWANGSEMVYGGQGYAGSNGATMTPTDFAFPGFPGDSTAWSESYPGFGAPVSANPPGDRRLVMTITDDYLMANSSICSDFALVFDQSGSSVIDNVQNVIDLAGQLRMDYTAQNGYPCFSPQFNALNDVEELVEFSLYPNPSSGLVIVSLPNTEDEVKIEVLDLSGRRVFEKQYYNTNEIQLNLNESSGIYLVKTEINTHSSIKRLILE